LEEGRVQKSCDFKAKESENLGNEHVREGFWGGKVRALLYLTKSPRELQKTSGKGLLIEFREGGSTSWR